MTNPAMYPVRLYGRITLTERQHLILNAAVFQLAWLVCILGGSTVALVTVAVVVILHLRLVRETRSEAMFLFKAAVIGFVCDLALIQAGVLNPAGTLPPVWLTSLWVLFGTTAGYALRIFHGRLYLCAACGALFAPLSYLGGARLANVALMEPAWTALLVISLTWALAFPLLIQLYTVKRWKPTL